MSHPSSLVVGVVGKPSVGKSTFFNSVTDGKNAKVGTFPFTTIEPNMGITYYRSPCASFKRGKVSECAPRYGRVRRTDGTRFIPVKLLDVAGLVPGASKGLGLGNKFLSDLCGADVLVHVIDVSGTTNEKGEATVGYDPVNDAEWLLEEITEWVFANLWGKWSSTARRHGATKQPVSVILGAQLNGYGGNKGGKLVQAVVDSLSIKDPVDLSAWGESEVRALVNEFVSRRFPMVLLLNKADPGALAGIAGSSAADTDRNITRVSEKYEPRGIPCVVGSASAELFLQDCARKGYLDYETGDGMFSTLEDVLEDVAWRRSRRLHRLAAVSATPPPAATSTPSAAAAPPLPQTPSNQEEPGGGGGGGGAGGGGGGGAVDQAAEEEKDRREVEAAKQRLKPLPSEAEDPKMARRLERLRDSVLYRFGSTGVWRAVQAAVDLTEPAVAFPVTSFTSFASGGATSSSAPVNLPNTSSSSSDSACSGGVEDKLEQSSGSSSDANNVGAEGLALFRQEECEANSAAGCCSNGGDGGGGGSDGGGSGAATTTSTAAAAAATTTTTTIATPPSGVGSNGGKRVFGDCYLLKKGTTVKQLGAVVLGGSPLYGHAEGEDGRRLADEHVIEGADFVCRFVADHKSGFALATPPAVASAKTHGASGGLCL